MAASADPPAIEAAVVAVALAPLAVHHLLEPATTLQLVAGDGSVRTLLGPTAAKTGARS